MLDKESLQLKHEKLHQECEGYVNPLRVVDVEYIRDFLLRLKFSNGEEKVIDFYHLLKGPLRGSLKDPVNFIQFVLTHYTLEWYNGVDFAPEYLYEQPDLSQKVDCTPVDPWDLIKQVPTKVRMP